MARRGWLIMLMIVEALLWCAANGLSFVRITHIFDPLTERSTPVFMLSFIGTLALSIVIGAISRGWQGAIALNLIASLPAALLAVVVFHASSNGGIGTLYLLAPLAALGWFGWLLRFVRAEFAA